MLLPSLSFYNICNALIGCSVIVLFISIVVNFRQEKKDSELKKKKKSIVETGSMTAFFVVIYFILLARVGGIQVSSTLLHVTLSVLGVLMIVGGVIFNIYGRFYLGSNWGNQVKIYKDHTLVTSGPYSIVRHPLYFSIICMFLGASFHYVNWIVFAGTLVIFVPFMRYRASQEEELLVVNFPEYRTYQERVGMLMPRFLESGNPAVIITNYEHLFCRISLTILVWVGFLFRSDILILISTLVFLLSAILSVRFAPIILIYRYTFGRFFPGKEIFLSKNGMRLAHSFGGTILAFGLIALVFIDSKVGWGIVAGFCVIKTISAFGFCPVSKLYTCAGSGCCPFLKKFSGMSK